MTRAAHRAAALIFDMDGVLVDTMPLHEHSWRQLAERENVRLELSRLDTLKSRSRRDSLEILLDDQALPDAQMQHLLQEKNRLYLDMLADFGPGDLLPGARELLEEARAAGVPLGLASSSRNARFICERLGIRPFFQAFADGTDVRRGKPAPDLYQRVVAELGVPARRCLVLEDGAAGVAAARSAGCFVVGIGLRAQLEDADVVLTDLSNTSLNALLTRLG